MTRHDTTDDTTAGTTGGTTIDAGADAPARPAEREGKPAPARRTRQRTTTSDATRAEAADAAPKPRVSDLIEQRLRNKARREGADIASDVITRVRDDYRRRVSASVLATLEAQNPIGFHEVRARRMRVARSMLDGMTPSAIAQHENVSRATVYNDWRVWLSENARSE